jgi:glycosyltransferase involved in cell wall biosynthesis
MRRVLFVTNIPSFYKVSLYNELNKYNDVSVIFLNSDRIKREKDFFNYENVFKNITFPSLNLVTFLVFIFKNRDFYDEVILGGWDRLYYWVTIFIPFKKISLALESSIYEINKNSIIKNWIKKVFLLRISRVYASGTPHKELLTFLNYHKDILITNGVGLINYPNKILSNSDKRVPIKFLFVGRIEKVKGIELLVEVFENIEDCCLSICGNGSMLDYINNRKNVNYLGYINNIDLEAVYKEHDVFILPSNLEPWGLVVEEALANGLPVIVSDKVGCAIDLISNNDLGLIFQANNLCSLKSKINELRSEKVYHRILKNVLAFSIKEKDKHQIQCYNR